MGASIFFILSLCFCSNVTSKLTFGICGDQIQDFGEECDDGNGIDTDWCTNLCKNAVCGDGIIRTAEETCEGSDPPHCRLPGTSGGCTFCGDEHLNGPEQCEPPNTLVCDATCMDKEVNECDLGMDNCHDDADCTDTTDSYYCTCRDGFTGDGVINCAVAPPTGCKMETFDACKTKDKASVCTPEDADCGTTDAHKCVTLYRDCPNDKTEKYCSCECVEGELNKKVHKPKFCQCDVTITCNDKTRDAASTYTKQATVGGGMSICVTTPGKALIPKYKKGDGKVESVTDADGNTKTTITIGNVENGKDSKGTVEIMHVLKKETCTVTYKMKLCKPPK